MRRHTGETPYPCKQSGCSQMFKWRSSLAHHMKTRHKVNVLPAHLEKPMIPSSPGAITDVRTATNVLSTRMAPFSTLESPAGSSSAGSPNGNDGALLSQHMSKPTVQHLMTPMRAPVLAANQTSSFPSAYRHSLPLQNRPGKDEVRR
jgi:hypothetical protein